MPQIINTNIASLNAQRNLNSAQRSQDTALERLSSGLRINSAKDDAAGLAISTRFDSQIRGTSVAVRNAGDAISLAQTAEGALDSINTSLQRIRELSLQAANDTNTDLDRAALQEEVTQLVEEIQVVSESANFNGKNLLDGSFQNSVFQTGANVGDTITVSISKLDSESLGSATNAGVSANYTNSSTGVGASGAALVAGDLVINGVSIGASSSGDDGSSTAQGASSAIAKAAAINAVSDQTGVTAVAGENVLAGTSTGSVAAADITISLNGVQIGLTKASGMTIEQNLVATTNAINERSGATGVRAVFSGNATEGVQLIAEDGRNISLGGTAANAAASFGLAATGASLTSASQVNTFVGGVTLISNDGSDINITSDTGNIDNAGFEVGTYSGTQSSLSGDNVTGSALASGDLVINGVTIGKSLAADDTSSITAATRDQSAISKAAAINRVSDQTGVTAIANETRLNSGNVTVGSSATITLNGVSVAVSLSSTTDTVADQVTKAIDAINAKSGATGITAEALDADSYTLVAADGRNITVAGASNLNGLSNTTTFSSIQLVSGGDIEISSQTGNSSVAGFRVGSFGNGESGTALKDIDVSTVAGAEAAVLAVDNAINTIASKRAELGAVQNRFENTIANLETTGENLNAANSRIRDADFAQETAALSRAQVLQQAGISVLAQANGRPQQVLSLLQ